jgi:branched-chain amino acid aminotransferase
MAFDGASKVWMDGSLVAWDDAKIHVCSHVIHYGSSVFEGIRCYDTPNGPMVFRLREHIVRLIGSAKIYRMLPRWTEDQLCQAVIETIRANGLGACYIRPVIYRGYKVLGVNPLGCPIDTAIAAWNWGQYLGEGAVKDGVDVTISTWNRLGPNTMPSMAKSGANYMNSQLIVLEARERGFAEGIALTPSGTISEGSGENVFVVYRGRVLTPGLTHSILDGITRDTAIRLLADHGTIVEERPIPREMLYLADEVFFTGTAAEITPVRSVDGIPVGTGKPGPLTRQVQEAFFAEVKGGQPTHPEWLTPVRAGG